MTYSDIERSAFEYNYDNIIFDNIETDEYPDFLVKTPYYGFYMVAKRVGTLITNYEFWQMPVRKSDSLKVKSNLIKAFQIESANTPNIRRNSIPFTLQLCNLLDEFITLRKSDDFADNERIVMDKVNLLISKIESIRKSINPFWDLDLKLAKKWCRALRLFAFLQMSPAVVNSEFSVKRDLAVCARRGIASAYIKRIEYRARFQKLFDQKMNGKIIILAEEWEAKCVSGEINADPHLYEIIALSFFESDSSYKAGYEWLTLLLCRHPDNIDLLKWQARYLRRDGKIEKSHEICKRILEINPTDFETHCFESNLYYLEENFLQAQKSALIATSCDEESPLGHVSLAYSYLYDSQYDEAISSFNRALEINPGNVDAFRGKSKALVMMGEGYDAMNCLVRAFQFSPDNAELFRELADVYFMSGYLEDCRRYCKKSLAIDPNSSGAYVLLGMLEIREGKTDAAMKWLNRSLDIDPDNPIALNELAYIEHVMGNDEECLRLLEKALDIAPDFADVVCSMGVVYYFRGEYETAHSLLDHALDLDPLHVGAMVTKGNALLAQSMADEALIWFDKALEIDSEFLDAIRGKADSLRSLGLEDEAAEWSRIENEYEEGSDD
jgi:tetratricopeptide (TPR) repeat protein